MIKPRIGMAMIMQNEETHVPTTIAQFYHVVDEIVVVDGGSTDKSVEWAERMGARVVHRPFDNDFSAQKNYAIEQLEADWVYLHDPDERLDPPLLEIIPLLATAEGQQILRRNDVLPATDKLLDCFGIPRKNFIDGEQTQIYPDYQYRFFRHYCRFEGAVHEKIVNFRERTEVDYLRPEAARPGARTSSDTVTTERGLLEMGVDIFDPANISRFNILHYKSSVKQVEQDTLYRKIRGD
jgi:glycosyltransferase involved in cell wall biosynthesis